MLTVAALFCAIPVPAATLTVTEDLRAVSTQLTGSAFAASPGAFHLTGNASADPLASLTALVSDAASDGAASGFVAAHQQSTLTASPDALSLTLTGGADAAATTGNDQASVLAAAISNVTFAFTVAAIPAHVRLQGLIHGSGSIAGAPGSFGLTALSVVGGGAALFATVTDGTGPVPVATGFEIGPGDYVLTLAANATAALPAGSGAAALGVWTSYDLAITVTAVPVPAAGVLLPFALALLGMAARRVSGASC